MAYNRRKRKVKKNIPEAQAHIHSTYNNTVVSITDVNGNVCVSSIGCSVGTHVGPGTYGIAYVEAAESGMNRESIVKTA